MALHPFHKGISTMHCVSFPVITLVLSFFGNLVFAQPQNPPKRRRRHYCCACKPTLPRLISRPPLNS